MKVWMLIKFGPFIFTVVICLTRSWIFIVAVTLETPIWQWFPLTFYWGVWGSTETNNFHEMQVIAGLVEHRLADQFSDQTLFVNMLSFVVRTINSYWGTQVRYRLKFFEVKSSSPFPFLQLSNHKLLSWVSQ